MGIGENALAPVLVHLRQLVIVAEIELISKTHTIQLRPATGEHRESDAVCHAHRANTGRVATMATDFLSLGLMHGMAGLIRCNLVKDGL
jgi:hypothetical protein